MIAHQLAGWAAGLDLSDIPDRVQTIAGRHLLDATVCRRMYLSHNWRTPS